MFDARLDGLADISTINAEGGTPKLLTDHPAGDHQSGYSADGRWIYFASRSSGERRTYRKPANGGDVLPITRNGGYLPVESPGGRWIYFSLRNGSVW